MYSFWVATSHLIHKGKYKWGSLITALPAAFMTAVSASYIMMAEEGFRLPVGVSYPVGIGLALGMLVIYFLQLYQWQKAPDHLKENWGKIQNRKAKKD